MLSYKTIVVLCCASAAASFPLNANSQCSSKRSVDPALVPSFGWQAGVNPDGTGNCDGAVNGTNGGPVLIPCQCPPNSTFFLAALNKNVAAGFVTTNPTVNLTFPTDNSTASQLARLDAAAVTLQNLEGPGVGCPISSTTFPAQRKAIEAETSNISSITTTPAVSPSSTRPSSGLSTNASRTRTVGSCPTNSVQTSSVASPTPAVSSPSTRPSSGLSTSASRTRTAGSCPTKSVQTSSLTSPTSTTNTSSTILSSGNATSPTDAQISALAPPLGWQSGINPDDTGNCDGAVNGTNGRPIHIPCQCPPDQTNYISNLTANIRAGHVVLNPTILLTFPTDNSIASQSARLNAAAVTIQNLNGMGIGCPTSSTNFTAQLKAISAQGSG